MDRATIEGNMIIETKTSNTTSFFITLEAADFRRRDRETGELVWRNALGWLKADIPADQREYDPDSYIWTIKDTPDNRAIAQAIKESFFEDKNQLRMF
jgi:hypothetical protein